MTQAGKAPAAHSEDPSSIPGTHEVKKGGDSYKSLFDLHIRSPPPPLNKLNAMNTEKPSLASLRIVT